MFHVFIVSPPQSSSPFPPWQPSLSVWMPASLSSLSVFYHSCVPFKSLSSFPLLLAPRLFSWREPLSLMLGVVFIESSLPLEMLGEEVLWKMFLKGCKNNIIPRIRYYSTTPQPSLPWDQVESKGYQCSLIHASGAHFYGQKWMVNEALKLWFRWIKCTYFSPNRIQIHRDMSASVVCLIFCTGAMRLM